MAHYLPNQLELWNKSARDYVTHANKKTGVFAYEKDVNSASVLELCPDEAVRVLDLGCGAGKFTKVLKGKYPEVIGADGSVEMLRLARTESPGEYKQFDFEDSFPEFNDGFDLIVAKLVLMFINDLDHLAVECSSLLSDKGSIVVSVTHPIRWLVCYMENKYKIRDRRDFEALYEGYYSEVPVNKHIGNNDDLAFSFMHRKIESYVNAFLNAGMLLDRIDEPRVDEIFLGRYPDYSERSDYPLRLNMRFTKL